MKSKFKTSLLLLSSFLILSCSNIFKGNSGKGNLSIQLPYAASSTERKALFESKENLLFVITISGQDDFLLTKEALSGEIIELELEEGLYTLDALAYNIQDRLHQYPLYQGKSDVEVLSNYNNQVDLHMTRIPAIDFIKNVWGNLEKNEYNYTWGRYVFELDPDFNKVIKKGDCARVTFTGTANTSFKGSLIATFAKDFYYEQKWTRIAEDSKEVSFTEGEEVTLSFDLIAQDDVKDEKDLMFNLFYEKDDYDDLLAFNEYSIEFNFNPDFSSINHTIHLGNKSLNFYVKEGRELELPDSNKLNSLIDYDLWDFSLEGYYLNDDFTGKKYTRLSAQENTKPMTFYPKFDFNLQKNIFGSADSGKKYYNYCGGFNIQYFTQDQNGLIIDDFSKLPQSGETFSVKVEGILDEDFSGIIGLDLVEDSVEWTSLTADRPYSFIKKNQKFTIYYRLTLPEDKKLVDLEHSGFNFWYELEDRDENLVIHDLKLTLSGGNNERYGEEYKPELAKTQNLILQTDSNGIKVTANLLVDGKKVKDLQIEDEDSLAQFRVDNSAIENLETYSFIWPLCSKDKLYKLEYKYNKDGQDYWESAWCKAGGGLGDPDNSNYEKIKLSLENAEDERNIIIENFSKDNLDIINLPDDYFNYKGFEVTLYSGLKNWSDTEWVYVYNYHFGDNAEGTIYEDLLKNNKINILNNYQNWKKPSELNEVLSKRKVCFIGMRSYFTLNDYEDGIFFSKEYLTEETPYIPAEITNAEASVSVSFPNFKTGELLIQNRETENGIEFDFTADKAIQKELDSDSCCWILTYDGEDVILSNEKSFIFSNELLLQFTKEGFYPLSILVKDKYGNTYSSTVYINLLFS